MLFGQLFQRWPTLRSLRKNEKSSFHLILPHAGSEHLRNARISGFLKQLSPGFSHQRHAPPDEHAIGIRLSHLKCVVLHCFMSTDSEYKHIRTSNDVGVGIGLKRRFVQWPWVFKTSCTCLSPFTFVAGTDFSWKTVMKKLAIRLSFFAYRKKASEGHITWWICSVPSLAAHYPRWKETCPDLNISCSARLWTMLSERARRMCVRQPCIHSRTAFIELETSPEVTANYSLWSIWKKWTIAHLLKLVRDVADFLDIFSKA